MAGVTRENYWRKFFGSRWFLLILLAASLLTSFAYGRAYYQDYQVRMEIQRLQEDVKRMEAKKLETTEILKYVQSPNFIEDKARTELNLIKPGEQVAVVKSIGNEEIEKTEKNEKNVENLSNPAKWWRLFWQGLPN